LYFFKVLGLKTFSPEGPTVKYSVEGKDVVIVYIQS